MGVQGWGVIETLGLCLGGWLWLGSRDDLHRRGMQGGHRRGQRSWCGHSIRPCKHAKLAFPWQRYVSLPSHPFLGILLASEHILGITLGNMLASLEPPQPALSTLSPSCP